MFRLACFCNFAGGGGVVYAGDSKITVTIAGEVELDLTATTAEGKFGTSTPATVSVSSDHFTGYTLSIKGDNAEGNLRGNTANLSSITNTAGISQETFANSVEYNGSWGFLPSKINSTDNTKYLPGPKNNSLIIDATKVANAEGVVNEYTLAIGARANMYTAIDSYANTFVITVTGNPPAYKINYEKNTAANVSNMPTTDIGQIGVMAANPTISRTTPTRTDGYRFVGWCDGGGALVDSFSCDGQIYAAGATYAFNPISTNSLNEVTLTAMWEKLCDPGKICYKGNGADAGIETGDQTMAASTATLILFVPNYKRAGYGFLGWSTKENPIIGTDKIYGPNETISGNRVGTELDTTNGLTLYAVWLPADANDTMQTFNTEGHAMCNDAYMTKATLTYSNSANTNVNDAVYTVAASTFKALRDERDNNVYVIGRLSDGECWMLENLRVDQTVSAEDMASGSQGLGEGFTKLANSENNFSTSTTANSLYNTKDAYTMPRYSWINTNDAVALATSTDANIYEYGNYYTWAAAKANTTVMTSSATSEAQQTSICPRGWRLPVGGNGDVAKSFSHLSRSIGGTNGGMNPSTTPNGTVMSSRLRQFPNNFVYSGYRYSSSIKERGASGYYWASTVSSKNYGHDLYFLSGLVGASSADYKYQGASVRCVAE